VRCVTESDSSITGPARTEPGRNSDERTMLEGWLDFHRATLRIKCAGLDDGQLRQASCPPSNLSLLGLVRHLTDVERGWFLRGIGRRPGPEVPPLYSSDENPEADIENLDSASTRDVFAAYEQTITEVKAITADVDLDRTFGSGDAAISARWVYLHMIEEYARHNGHADLIRERIDGATGS
jgi:hypothetical protein